ncbi:TonB-dependent receptor [Amantichitinum ursilacus]|uniref:Ferric enterobactin receptor n=1 Tax=Amantichitinum ursilacus TaxID=857265 RepID=A0A0N0XK78_9NEIS|nr:TonB-dependent receptor [Amantichitinum ursilacus]KPC54219.1 Ferric enterobactin receptor precursor [Amantichitinum ursilacus]
MPFPTLRPLAALLAGLSFNAMAHAADSAADEAAAQNVERVDVTATRLKNARIGLSPKVGTTVYTLDQGLIDGLGQGDATPLDELLLRLPGVDKDSKASGGLHARDDHGDVQYRIDGVQLPESIAGFGASIDTRYVDRIDFLTGALPAQYGLRTAGVVDIQTKSGSVKPGGSIGMLVGSHDTLEPSLALYGSAGRLNYYLSGSYNRNSAGIENPTDSRNADHDDTRQSRSFGDLQYFVDDSTRLGFLFGTYNGRYQIPTNPDQDAAFALAGYADPATGFNLYPSSQVNEQQHESTRFFVATWQKQFERMDGQISAFHQYSDLHFSPDAIGDLIYNGVASDTRRSNSANGLQADASYALNAAHTVRLGALLQRQQTASNNSVSVFSTDEDGAQSSDIPFTVSDNSGKTGTLASVYVQDEWRIDPALTVNYGVRYDHVAAFTQEQQFSPRVNVAYKLSDATAVHAGFSRYFTPPPQELAAQDSIALYNGTTNQAAISTSDPVKAERTSYYDIGISHVVSPAITVAADAYYKHIRNLLDEGQFGQALILSPFNYAEGYAQGVELSSTFNKDNWTGYLNAAYQQAKGKHIVSGQALFDPDELAYIANHQIYLDHDQTYTLSGGLSYRYGASSIGGDFLFGSGLRNTPDGGAPNSSALPHYTVVNGTLTHTWKYAAGEIEGRLAVLNLFDKSYLLRDGSGVGVGAPQYGARRSYYAGVTTTF